MDARLLEGRFEPITFTIGFLECRAEEAHAIYLDWQRKIYTERAVQVDSRQVEGSFAAKLHSLLPLTSVLHLRSLFCPTAGSWTAYFDNGWRGTDAFSAISYLATLIGCRGVRTVVTPHTVRRAADGWRGKYGATMFEVYAPSPPYAGSISTTQRSVYAANDGGPWKFGARGEPFDFEELEQYAAKRIQDRFTPEMLDRYLKKLGIDRFSEAFYDVPEPAYLVFKEGLSPPGMKEYSLEEVQARF